MLGRNRGKDAAGKVHPEYAGTVDPNHADSILAAEVDANEEDAPLDDPGDSVTFDSPAAHENTQHVQDNRQQRHADLVGLRLEWDRVGAELREQQNQCIEGLIDICEGLQQQQHEQTKAFESAQAELIQLRAEREHEAPELVQLRTERDRLVSELTQAQQQRDEAAAALDALQQEHNGQSQEIAELSAHHEQVSAELEQLRKERDALAAEKTRLREERKRALAILQLGGGLDESGETAGSVPNTPATVELDGEGAPERSSPTIAEISGEPAGTTSMPSSSEQPVNEPATPSVATGPDTAISGSCVATADSASIATDPVPAKTSHPTKHSPPQSEATSSPRKVRAGANSPQPPPAANAKTPTESDTRSPAPPPGRRLNSTRATVIRDNDQLKAGIDGVMRDVSCIEVRLLLPTPLKVDEYVLIELENANERIKVSERAIVREVDDLDDGWYQVVFGLLNQISYREVRGLRQS